MIELKNVEKCFVTKAGQTFVLRRINLKIEPGEFVTVMGPSGAGKSTLLSILGMLDHAWTGEYRLLEHQVHGMKPKERIDLNKKYGALRLQPDDERSAARSSRSSMASAPPTSGSSRSARC